MSQSQAAEDRTQMRAALSLGRRNLGSTWPNPSVGCVLVRDGVVVGRGVTAPGGRPHAEVVALAAAREAARGATAYVTLEPCSHHGATPPCADALVAAGVRRVVVACGDPDARVDGKGTARLREAGIEVCEGVLEAAAAADQFGFLTRVRLGRPAVTLKLASTLDGRIATRTGDSQWITGPRARRMGHALRGSHDAVMVGMGTVRADDPMLTCRIEGYRTRPVVRIVADTNLRIDPASRLVSGASESPTWLLHRCGAEPGRLAGQAGLRFLPLSAGIEGIDLVAALSALGTAGLTRVLVEGGAGLASGLLRANLVDRIAWFHAPGLIGGDGLPSVQGFGVDALVQMARFRRTALQAVGSDVLTLLETT